MHAIHLNFPTMESKGGAADQRSSASDGYPTPMSERETTTTDNGLEDAVDAYHEARAGIESAATVKVTDAGVDKTTDTLHPHLRIDGRSRWVRLRSHGDCPHWNALSHLDNPEEVDNRASLIDTRHEFRIDPEDKTILDLDGNVIGEFDRHRPAIDGNVADFVRKARVEKALTGTPPHTTATLSASGDEHTVKLDAEVGGEHFHWRFDIPDTIDFPDSDLRELIETVGAGDPDGLDGHRVTVCRPADVGDDTTAFTDVGRNLAIVPEEVVGESSNRKGVMLTGISGVALALGVALYMGFPETPLIGLLVFMAGQLGAIVGVLGFDV